MKYREITGAEWRRIVRVLRPGSGRWAISDEETRKHLNGMLYVLQFGCPWREMDPKYGKWNSVYVRFRRWAEKGVWDLLIDELVSMGRTEEWRYATRSEAAGSHGEGALTREARVKTALFEAARAVRTGESSSGLIQKAVREKGCALAIRPQAADPPPAGRIVERDQIRA